MDVKMVDNFIGYIQNGEFKTGIDFGYKNIGSIVNFYMSYIETNGSKTRNQLLVPYSDNIYQRYVKINKLSSKERVSLLRLSILKLIHSFKKLQLEGIQEIKMLRNNTTYITIVGNTETNIKLFFLYLVTFYAEAKIRARLPKSSNRKIHVGIDYEFSLRQIALMQINFEHHVIKNKKTNSYIWIVNPGQFNLQQMNLLIKHLMTNMNIYKILHGADSLDIPYMYEQMFGGQKDLILKFTKRFFDTRFLCEYFKTDIEDDHRCNIYEALKYFGTISDNKFNDLNKIHDAMGPVQDISWEISKMSSFHLKYTLYDVLFLKHFLYDIYRHIHKITPQRVKTYRFIISIIRFIFVERREITDVIETAKKDIDPINNYLIKHRSENITLISIYNQIIENFIIPKENIDVSFILRVNYFRKSLSVLFKKIIYYLVITNFTVYKTKHKKMEEPFTLEQIYRKLEQNGFKKIIHLLNLFQNEAYHKLVTLYKRS